MTHKTVIITGASRGIGAAMAKITAEQGAAVVINARSEDALRAVAAEIEQGGGKALVVPGDVSDPAQCAALVEQTIAQFGRIDALINNAGILEPISPIAETDPADWQYNFAVNLLGPLMLIQAAIPYLREQNGRVINISSGAATRGTAGWAAYCASKAALNQITRVLALEEPAITALAVRPGIVDTEMQAVIRSEGKSGMIQADHQRFIGFHQNGQLLPPEIPSRALVALALHAPKEWSGDFLSWDDDRVEALMG
ncbi:MAG: SDR family oxidoreductase, partial [Candidatus Promineifilaceae bacterium]